MQDEFQSPPPQDPPPPQSQPAPAAQQAYTYVPPAPPPPPQQPYGYYAARPPRRPRSPWFWIGIIGGAAVVLVCLFSLFVYAVIKAGGVDTESTAGSFGSGGKIGVIEVNGVILSSDKFNEQLRKMADNDDVKAIILRINSPGGGAAASQEIYHEVLRVKQAKHKKIIASIESVGASGAYYIASGCDRIYANQASVVGSIGVIMEWMNYGDLMRWAKLKDVILKAGELKDAGSPTRDLTPKEQAYFQSLVDNMHVQFIHDVATGRHVADDKIKPLATGQVWTGEQALPLGLIDRQGGYRDALMETAKEVGISGEPGIVRPRKEKTGLLSALVNSDPDDIFPNPSKLLNEAPGFYFMWK